MKFFQNLYIYRVNSFPLQKQNHQWVKINEKWKERHNLANFYNLLK